MRQLCSIDWFQSASSCMDPSGSSAPQCDPLQQSTALSHPPCWMRRICWIRLSPRSLPCSNYQPLMTEPNWKQVDTVGNGAHKLICLSIHLEDKSGGGGGGCLTQALSRLINTYLQPVCEKQLNNTSTLHTEEYRAPPQPKRRIGVNATYADCSRRQRRFITR